MPVSGFIHELIALLETARPIARTLENTPSADVYVQGRNSSNWQSKFTELDALITKVGTAATALASAASTLKGTFANVS